MKTRPWINFTAITSLWITIFMITGICTAIAQPSGGPYGPIQQSWELPRTNGTIYYVAVDGAADADGMSIDTPSTLAAVIEKVVTNDVIIMRGGTYRTGHLKLNQGITLQPWQDEQPVIKGTLIADEWRDLGNGLWTTSWDHLFPQKPQSWWRRHRQGKYTPQWRFNNDMVFIDGRFLQSVGWEGHVDKDTYYIDYDKGVVYIGIDPTDKLVEITAYNSAIIRTTDKVHGKEPDRKGPTIRGITFTQYAYRALEIEGTDPEGLSPEVNHGKMVVGTTLEHCEISYCSRVAGYFRGDSLTIRHCKISDTSTEGIYILSSNDVLLEKNIFTRNNIEQITGYYPAAVKIFNQCYRVTCNDNLVIDHPKSNGIWYDVGNVDGVFTNNWIENVGSLGANFSTKQLWPSDNGFFFEISKGAVCANNVFVNCDHGVLVLNSNNVHLINNTFYNSTACIGRDGRSAQGDHFGWHPSTGPDVDERKGHIFANNLMVGGSDYIRSLLLVWQSLGICDQVKSQQVKLLDHNVYVRQNGNANNPIILWGPVDNENCQAEFFNLESFRKNLNVAKHSRYYNNYKGPLFKSIELGNYELMPEFTGMKTGMQMPKQVKNRIKSDTERMVGAFPPAGN